MTRPGRVTVRFPAEVDVRFGVPDPAESTPPVVLNVAPVDPEQGVWRWYDFVAGVWSP